MDSCDCLSLVVYQEIIESRAWASELDGKKKTKRTEMRFIEDLETEELRN